MNPTPGYSNNPISSENFIFNSPLLDATNYPNPFNPETTIYYQLPEDSEVELIIYNIKGQKVKTLVDEQLQQGEYSTIWDGRDSDGKQANSGIYFYKLKACDYWKVGKMLLLK